MSMIAGIRVELLQIFHWLSPLIFLLGFHLPCSCFIMPFIPISTVCTERNCDGPLVGIRSCSLVKTDLKWSFSVFALL